MLLAMKIVGFESSNIFSFNSLSFAMLLLISIIELVLQLAASYQASRKIYTIK